MGHGGRGHATRPAAAGSGSTRDGSYADRAGDGAQHHGKQSEGTADAWASTSGAVQRASADQRPEGALPDSEPETHSRGSHEVERAPSRDPPASRGRRARARSARAHPTPRRACIRPCAPWDMPGVPAPACPATSDSTPCTTTCPPTVTATRRSADASRPSRIEHAAPAAPKSATRWASREGHPPRGRGRASRPTTTTAASSAPRRMRRGGVALGSMSGRQDSNLRSPAPKAGALATTLRPAKPAPRCGEEPAWSG